MMAEEVADMVAEKVVGMGVDKMVVDIKYIFQNLPYFPLLVGADTQVDRDNIDDVKVAEETIKVKNVRQFGWRRMLVFKPGGLGG